MADSWWLMQVLTSCNFSQACLTATYVVWNITQCKTCCNHPHLKLQTQNTHTHKQTNAVTKHTCACSHRHVFAYTCTHACFCESWTAVITEYTTLSLWENKSETVTSHHNVSTTTKQHQKHVITHTEPLEWFLRHLSLLFPSIKGNIPIAFWLLGLYSWYRQTQT